MIRNWYAVYTRPQKEKKVTQFLGKKGIEAFWPAIFTCGEKSSRKKEKRLPLFNSLVFVHAAESEVRSVAAVPWIINFLYWRSKPAIISCQEIDLVKKLNAGYSNIRLEKCAVDTNGKVQVLDGQDIAYNENTVSVKYKSIKVNLPSLGCIITAQRGTQKEESYQPQGLFGSFPRKLNAFLFN